MPSSREQNLTVSSISATVDRDSSPAPPPAYDLILKQPINNDIQPPTYESLFYKMKNAQRNFRETVQNNALPNRAAMTSPSLRHRISHTATVFTLFVFFIILPIVKIVVGSTFKDECPINSSIPLWLIIDGVFFLLLAFSVFLFKYLDCSLMTSVIFIFLFSWLVRGSVWVYGIYTNVSFNPKNTKNYCETACYETAFWTITLTWCLTAFALILVISSFIFKNKIQNPLRQV